VRHGGIDEERFLAAYLAELDHMAGLSGPRAVGSVFFGGGTPSLMRPQTVAALIDRIARNWHLEGKAEITLEANPTSVEAANFAALRACGVNRVSLGVQALADQALKALGRQHDAAEARAAVAVAQSHFERVSIDLIYARPGQGVRQWEAELEEALGLGLGHLSLYQLTIEPGTPFAALHAAGKLAVPDADRAAALYEATQGIAAQAGLPAYEISNHARPGEECRHNLLYWRSGDYAGVGPGAHGRLAVSGKRHHLETLRNPESWRGQVEAEGHGLAQSAALDPGDEAREMLLMGLRLSEGVALDRLGEIGGGVSAEGLAMMRAQGLADVAEGRLVVSPEGRLVLDAVIAELAM